MLFANPFFLFGFIAISIPVLIHLFNFRRFKKVYFTNVKFIEELKQETQKQSKLKHLLILFSRILAIICLVLAFAQPYIPLQKQPSGKSTRNAVSIYIDNSFSMEAKGRKGTLLDEAKSKALEIASAYAASDLFQIITSDFEGRHQRLVSREELPELVNDVKLTPVSRILSEVITRQQDLFSTTASTRHISYILSDFQKSTNQMTGIPKDSSLSVFLLPVHANQTGNLFIDSCWFESPVQQLNQQATLKIRIRNLAGSDQEKIPLKLFIDNSQRAVASFNCQAGGETEVSLSFTHRNPGIHQGRLEIVDYPVTYDDHFFFSFNVITSLPVLCINGKDENPYLNNLFSKDSSFQYRQVDIRNLDYSSLSNYHLLILNEPATFSSGFIQEITAYLNNGGSIVLIPSPSLNTGDYNRFLLPLSVGIFREADTANSKVAKMDAEHGLYRDVFDKIPENLDLPVVFAHFPFVFPNQSGAEVILKLQNDDPFLCSFPVFKGKMYILSSPLRPDFNNFGKHVLFVPTFYKIALLSQPSDRLYYTLGKEEAITPLNAEVRGDNVYKLRKVDRNIECIPENRILNNRMVFYMHDQLKEAGNFNLLDGTLTVAGISFNYDPRESNLDFYQAEELQELISKAGLTRFYLLNTKDKPVSMVIQEWNKGIRYWKFFVLLTLLFIVAEVLLLRFWRKP